jgi:hypothetical protein
MDYVWSEDNLEHVSENFEPNARCMVGWDDKPSWELIKQVLVASEDLIQQRINTEIEEHKKVNNERSN